MRRAWRRGREGLDGIFARLLGQDGVGGAVQLTGQRRAVVLQMIFNPSFCAFLGFLFCGWAKAIRGLPVCPLIKFKYQT